jgi:hypothetical protein
MTWEDFCSLWLPLGFAMAMATQMPLKWVAACWGYYET